MTFAHEADFEKALVKALSKKGWEEKVLQHPTEKDLIRNWADILYENNRGIDRLNNYPLTDGEMQQILEQITKLRTPLSLNGFINGKTVSVVRDNPDDKLHLGKEISLKIYDRREIAAGQSRYQIAEQPEFKTRSAVLNDRRGDLMLLINGMPVIHIELKRSGISARQACTQIEKYAHEGIFSGIFALVQVFVAMEPAETLYFANPGPDGVFNSDYYFHWEDFNNEYINSWNDIASSLLSIPMAHQLIGFYTVADESDGKLKVMRSYQYYAANAISDKVSKIKWGDNSQLGGFIWHTTGSGKTMTSFKSAQLIANSNDADKVVFLTDRIELGTQSLRDYRGFAEQSETVRETENTGVLITTLKSSAPSDTLIVTSIQKMSNIRDEDGGRNARDIELINKKRIVFIVDEAHRSTFGDMLITIKNTFPRAVFFGFTGTPIQEENQKKMNTTATVFGSELHRYSIADGIRDKNVLGFDPYKVLTFKDRDVRKAVALDMAKAKSEDEALGDSAKSEVYYRFMDSSQIEMAGHEDKDGTYIKGIEDYLPEIQYHTEEYRGAVVEDIKENWKRLSHNGKFHAIFATSSIPEAIEYYRLMKKKMPALKTTCQVDPSIDNTAGFDFKEDGLVEIIEDYNKRYNQNFSMAEYNMLKKDISSRLAHKDSYRFIEKKAEEQIDMLIVVNQMLTGFDSKWINTLYLDKTLEYENVIQAFSRTNRLFGPEKPFGTVRYYRRPHTMERNIEKAVGLYSGNKPYLLFAEKLEANIEKMNQSYTEIVGLFENAGIDDFSKLPEEHAVCAKFASLFKEFNQHYEAAKIQGFTWNKANYGKAKAEFDEQHYDIFVQRYKELSQRGPDSNASGTSDPGVIDVPYDLEGYLTEIDTGKIDADYMNSRFEKYLRILKVKGSSDAQTRESLDELHKTFASLSQDEQKYATIFLHDVERGEVTIEEGKTLRDYINEYLNKAKSSQVHHVADIFGLDEDKLQNMMALHLCAENINEYGRFDELKNSVDKSKARTYLEEKEGVSIMPAKVSIETDRILREFILNDSFESKE